MSGKRVIASWRQRSPQPREAELAARWAAGVWRGQALRAQDGATYHVLYQGRPGGGAGPDFRDAVLLTAGGGRITGDIELHLTPAGWRAHGHHTDRRYDSVALHVTLTAGAVISPDGTPLASGGRAPLVVLGSQAPAHQAPPSPWPCASVGAADQSTCVHLRDSLRRAGWERLIERANTIAVTLARFHLAESSHAQLALWTPPDRALFITLAEAMGYGRDRDALRACGERLASGASPDALLIGAVGLGRVERARLAALLALRDRWQSTGPTAALRAALLSGWRRADAAGACRALIEELAAPGRWLISQGRARILAINVALPWLLLHARHTHDALLRALLTDAIERMPGLPSNQITREMARQLELPRLPSGALAQQGLHHLWARHCREKRCDSCPCARPPP